MRDIRELKYLQSLPLEQKIEMTAERIDGWYQHYDGNVAVSFSGGKDSTVLLDIARNHWRGHKNIKAVFVDTGLEYPEIRQFVKTFDNVEIIRPKMNFVEVIKTYGYPIISKEVSERVYNAKKCIETNGEKYVEHYYQITGEFLTEQNRSDYKERLKTRFDFSKWKALLECPFRISHMCCNVMKKKPIKEYLLQTGLNNMTGQMAAESRLRTQKWLQNGCNGFDMKNPISNPMAFWTEQDVLEYIYEHNLTIAEPYGEVVLNECQFDVFGNEHYKGPKYATTGCDRTGCMFCAFGAHLEKGITRFQRLKETHPKQYNYCLNGGEFVNGLWQPNKQGLGMRYVFDELNRLYGNDFIRYE